MHEAESDIDKSNLGRMIAEQPAGSEALAAYAQKNIFDCKLHNKSNMLIDKYKAVNKKHRTGFKITVQ
jgi:hypothetical protein